MDINVVSWNMQGWGSKYGANEKKIHYSVQYRVLPRTPR